MLLEVSVMILCFLMIMHNRLGIDMRLIWIIAIVLIIINHQIGFEKARIEQFNTLQEIMFQNKVSYEKFGTIKMEHDRFGNDTVISEPFYNQQRLFERFRNKRNKAKLI